MAEMVNVDGQQFMKRNPLGVLGLSVVTLGVYFFVWYYKINNELRRAEDDQTISPLRSLLAITIGWVAIVPPFIAMYNTGLHIRGLETRRGVSQTVEPTLALALMLAAGIANGPYLQDHLNRAWGGSPTRVTTSPAVQPIA
jgi:hypothetical protein